MVDSTVVARDTAYSASSTGMKMPRDGRLGAVTYKPNNTIPRAERVYYLGYPQKLAHTDTPKSEDQKDNCCLPALVAYDPAPPNL
jgi:hypothetical protein